MSEQQRLASDINGQEWRLTLPPITRKQLVMYAGASGDFNPIHYDDAFAQTTGLPGVIAHGMLSMGFLGQLAVQIAGPEGRVLELSCRFLNMVFPGDELTVMARAVSVQDEGRLDLAMQVINQRGEQVVSGSAVVGLSGHSLC